MYIQILTVTRAHSIRSSLNLSPVDGKNAGVARMTAATEDLMAYRTCCCLNHEKNPQSEMKKRRHLVLGSGVCKVFMVLWLFGTNESDDLLLTAGPLVILRPTSMHQYISLTILKAHQLSYL
jgi:hypothetical protein